MTNLGACIVETLFEFILDAINLACTPFLNLVHKFLSEPVNISVFASIWGIIVYILSMFYGLLLVWIGLKFIVSAESPEKRTEAKGDLKSIIIMMILVQGSYHLYDLIIAISSALTKTILNLVGNNFFQLTLSHYYNFGFDLVFGILYLIHLIVVLVLLLLRYISVSSGVIFFAIGIFFYFFSPLNQYGRLIINGLCTLIFLPFFYSIMFLIGSKISELSAFRDFKTMIMVGTLDMIIISTALLLLFVIVKAALKVNKLKQMVNLMK
ncbi:MAG TPA: hypothetical protein VJ438_05855 [Candidatus Nanoarchaeia archaeon]|nr:hypothetical protein [Candidatus Nanoarchaeia archaeon]